jgi:hypothetical protein
MPAFDTCSFAGMTNNLLRFQSSFSSGSQRKLGMRCNNFVLAMALFGFAAAHGPTAAAAEARHFSFAYDQPHTTAYGIAADTFANKLAELSHGTMIIDQFPGA